MSTNYLKASPEIAGINPEDIQAIQNRAARVAIAVNKIAATNLAVYPEAPVPEVKIVPKSSEVQTFAAAPVSEQLSLAQQAVLNALEKKL